MDLCRKEGRVTFHVIREQDYNAYTVSTFCGRVWSKGEVATQYGTEYRTPMCSTCERKAVAIMEQ